MTGASDPPRGRRAKASWARQWLRALGPGPIGAAAKADPASRVVAPPMLALIVLVSGRRAALDERADGWVVTVLGWLTVAVGFAVTVTAGMPFVRRHLSGH